MQSARVYLAVDAVAGTESSQGDGIFRIMSCSVDNEGFEFIIYLPNSPYTPKLIVYNMRMEKK